MQYAARWERVEQEEDFVMNFKIQDPMIKRIERYCIEYGLFQRSGYPEVQIRSFYCFFSVPYGKNGNWPFLPSM